MSRLNSLRFRRTVRRLCVCAGLTSTSLLATVASAGEPGVLPLERVRMYETGVAYFERGGAMHSGSELQLPVPAAHLDDALKTLVVLSPGGQARVSGVAFASSVSDGAARALAGLPEEGEVVMGYEVVLRSLEGQRVEVSGKGIARVRGRLVEVEGPLPVPPVAKGETAAPVEPQWNLVVLDEDGSLRRMKTDEVEQVRPLEAGAAERIELASSSLSRQGAQRNHDLSLAVERSGRVELGYVAEAPVWRTSYRVVLTDDGQALMQAWALVHNDTDEAWKDVQIELANGEPTSFLFPLAAPRYARRELRAPEVDLYTVPQLALETPDGMWADGTGQAWGYGYGSGSIGAGGMGLVGRGAGGGGTAHGSIGLGQAGSVSGGSLELGDLADFAQADGSESEAQFVYHLRDPIDLEAHHSALVPVFAQAVDAQSVTLFYEDGESPMHGLRLVNSTPQSLPAGTVALFADGGFAGEATLDRLKPGEPRYLSFGRDLDVELSREEKSLGEERRELLFIDGTLHEHYVDRTRIEIRIDNRAGRTRNAYVALHLPRNAKIESEAQLDWDPERGEALVRVEAPGRNHGVAEVTAGTAGSRAHSPAGTSAATLERWIEDDKLPARTREILRRALVERKASEAAREAMAAADLERSEALAELERRRADLKALAASGQRSDANKRTGKRVTELETEIERLAAEARRQGEIFAARDVAYSKVLAELPASMRAAKRASAD